MDGTNGSAGLGISVGDPADTRKGHGSDPLRAMLRFGFGRLRLERIWLDVDDSNEAAKRLYDRIGFVTDARLRHTFWRDGRWVDTVRMAMLSHEWGVATERETARQQADRFSRAPRPDGSARGSTGRSPRGTAR